MMFPNPGPRIGAGAGQTWQLIVDGDSNTDQAYSTSLGFTGWWLQLQALLSGSRFTAASGDNLATAGNDWANLTSRLSTFNALATATRTCALAMCGTNDRLHEGISAATMAARAQTWLNGVTSCEAIGLIQIPSLGDASNDAVVSTYNGLLAGLTPPAGVQMFVIPRPSQLSDFSNTAYFVPDNIHINSAACAVLAEAVKASAEANLP